MHAPSLSARIRDFALLTPEERARVIEDVKARPDLEPELKEAMSFAQLADAATSADSSLVGFVDVRLGHRAEPPLAPAGEVAEIHAQLDSLKADIECPREQFERLTGRTLGPLASEATRPLDSMHASMHAVRPQRSGEPSARGFWRILVFVVLGYVGVYVVLFAVSALRTSERTRVADVADVAASFREGDGTQAERYATAVATLGQARRSTLGLFPRYDDESLNQAADAFAEIAREAPGGSYGQESALAIGRIRLLQVREDEARLALESIVAHGGYRAPEAARLLDYLTAQSAAQ